MKIHLKYLLILISILFTLSSYAKLPTGQWQTHMSYVDGQRLAVSSNKVYVVASGSLFSYGINDNALETYTKITGLSDVYINDIAFCESTETLVICYANGNIDLMSDNGIINIPDLYLKPIYGDKTINKVDIFEGTAYISTAFGILKLSIANAEISETYKLSNGDANGTNGVAILDNEIYAATENGLYKADLDDPNLQNFAAWSLVTSIGNETMPIRGIITFNSHILATQYIPSEDHNYVRQQVSDSDWGLLTRIKYFNSFGANKDILIIANEDIIKTINTDFQVLPNISSYKFSELEYSSQNDIAVNHAIPIDENSFFVADKNQGLIIYHSNAATETYKPKGPATNTIWDINIEQNILRTVHGALTTDWAPTLTPGAISTYNDNSWSFIDTKTEIPWGYEGRDMVSIVTDPNDLDHYYAATFHRGILEFQDDKLITEINHTNSTLTPVYGTTIWTSGLIYDSKHNLWATNSYVSEKLHFMNDDREWMSFIPNLSEHVKMTGDITFTEKENLWIHTPYWGKGIIAYSPNETLEDETDDITKYFSIYATNSDGTSEFISDNVLDITLDNDNRIWVGNDNGVAIYNSPDNIFDSNGTPQASRVNIPRNDGTGLGDYLLDGTTVNSISVDGGNRKWLATATTGVMLVSSDGQDLIHHFTKENSSLLDNNVRQVEINQETGEVFFATEAGLISYQADATSGEADFSNLRVYPNPVREDFFGDITITGLVDETTVKITDVSGNLVNETESNGGTAIWNGKNFYGERVGTGVYLIFCSDLAGERSGMTKILVIN